MSRLLILFLIALLPLRGWTVERMGMVESAHAPVALHPSALADRPDMPADCALHMRAALADTDASSAPAQDVPAEDAHKGCQSCQLCMPLATLEPTGVVGLPRVAQAMPRAGSVAFASAEPVRHAKPPIC